MELAAVPVSVVIAPYSDYFRKPYPGMWHAFASRFLAAQPPASAMAYVGDMCGRNEGKVKDKAASDLFLARNWGVPFHSPEAFIDGATDTVHTNFDAVQPQFDASRFRALPAPDVGAMLGVADAPQEVVVMVGPPASGKSSLALNHFNTYVRVNMVRTGWSRGWGR